jgi:spore coat polysaccharide biosynthesis predicted glycosyltransferase SpsG
MAELMLWADLAIIGDGLTKYEAAVTGTPSLMVSRPGSPSKLNRAFAETGATHSLGLWTELEVERLSETIHQALRDHSWRAKLSRKGKALVDGRGRERILESIPNELTGL